MYALHQQAEVIASKAALVAAAKMVVVVTTASFDGARGHAPDQRTPLPRGPTSDLPPQPRAVAASAHARAPRLLLHGHGHPQRHRTHFQPHSARVRQHPAYPQTEQYAREGHPPRE